MTDLNTLANASNLREVQTEEWIPFLDEFTRQNRGAHARLEIVGATESIGYQVETENRPFDGVSADVKDGEHTVWISFGAGSGNHLTHGVFDTAVLRTLLPGERIGPVLEIESAGGTKHILSLTTPEAYALPPSR